MPLPENAPRALQAAVVPAAGWGTRLRPLSDSIPKELLPLGRSTVLEHILAELAASGFSRVIFVVSPAKEPLIRSRFGTKSEGMCVEYAVQSEMRGLGDAVLRTRPLLQGEDEFVVALGDAVFVESEPGTILGRLLAVDQPIAIAVQRVERERLSRYGVVKPAADSPLLGPGDSFRIDGIVEKPALGEAPSEFAVAARYRLPAPIFDALNEAQSDAHTGELNLTGAIQTLLARGTPAAAVPLLPEETRHDIGSFETYWRAFITVALADPDLGAELKRYIIEEVTR
jgi:UTP--glucose-1-phosphate uridylyltransferase